MVVGVLCVSLFCCALLCVLSNLAIILKGKRERAVLVALHLLSYGSLITVNFLWVGLRYVVVVFPDHTHLLFVLLCTLYYLLYGIDIFSDYSFLLEVTVLLLES